MINLDQVELTGYKDYTVVATEDGEQWLVRGGRAHDVAYRRPFLRDPAEDVDRSGLFIRFSELREKPGAVRAFADESGHLCFQQTFVRRTYGNGQGADDDPSIVPIPEVLKGHTVAEPLEFWYDTIRQFRYLVGLWRAITEAVNSGSSKSLEKFVRFVENGRGEPVVVVDHRLTAPDRFDPRASDRFGAYAYPVDERIPHDVMVLNAGSGHLAEVVSRHMASSSIETVTAFNAAAQGFSVWTRPKSLRAGLWLQFSDAMAGRVKYNQCIVCGEWFALSHSADSDKRRTRDDKKYCSARCRGILYRDRRRAREMASEGKTLEQISKAINTPTKTVADWITDKKGS